MKRIAMLVLSLMCGPTSARAATPVSTAFTYQGALDRSGIHVGEGCQFQFKLFDAALGIGQIGPTLTPTITVYETGNFSAELDFGSSVFTGNARWLEIAVQCPGDVSFTTLTPRQPLTAAPYALYALSAPGGGFSLPFTGSATNQGSTTNGIDALLGIGVFAGTNTATTGLSHGVIGKTTSTWHNATGVLGVGLATSGFTSGVQGYATASPNGTGVVGSGQSRGGWFQSSATGSYAVEGVGVGRGITGSASAGDGVYGTGTNAGVYGSGTTYGVVGSTLNGFGVWGEYGVGLNPPNGTNAGVYGQSNSSNAGSAGVRGQSTSGFGVHGISTSAPGVRGESSGNDGIVASTSAANRSGIWAYSTNANGFGIGCANFAGGVAFRANGLAQVNTLQILGADLAESFPVREKSIEPGTVLMLDDQSAGQLRVSNEAYSHRVAGVVSGANGLDAGVVLKGHSFDNPGHAAVALSGRVWVKCDATRTPICVGDLLTTSAHAGHAMAAKDRDRAYGAILGKAMTSLDSGTGLVLVLVSLQ